jgi:hypothetical protein
MNGDTASQMSDSLAVFMEDVDEYDDDDDDEEEEEEEEDDDDDDEADNEFITQQSQIITPTIPVQPLSAPSPNIKRKPMM